MKLNWGTSIAIFYSLFALTMVGFVIKSKSIDHDLVVDDYYAKDLAYQQQYDKLTNSQALATNLIITSQKGGVQLLFPKETQDPSGEILFYRADDKRQDFSVEIATDAQGMQLVPTDKLVPGRWTIKVDWQAGGKPFYTEKIVLL